MTSKLCRTEFLQQVVIHLPQYRLQALWQRLPPNRLNRARQRGQRTVVRFGDGTQAGDFERRRLGIDSQDLGIGHLNCMSLHRLGPLPRAGLARQQHA